MWKLGSSLFCRLTSLSSLRLADLQHFLIQTPSWSLRLPSSWASKTSHFAGSASVSKWTSDGCFTCHRSHLRTCLRCSSWLYLLCRLTWCSPMECRGCGWRKWLNRAARVMNGDGGGIGRVVVVGDVLWCSGIVDLLEEEEREQRGGWYWTMSGVPSRFRECHVRDVQTINNKKKTTKRIRFSGPRNLLVTATYIFAGWFDWMIPNDDWEEDFEKWYVVTCSYYPLCFLCALCLLSEHHCTGTLVSKNDGVVNIRVLNLIKKEKMEKC